MVDLKKALLASLNKHKSTLAEDVETFVEPKKGGGGNFLPAGFHEGCEIVAVEVGESAADKNGNEMMNGDSTFARCFITFEKDGKSKRGFYGIPTKKCGYGINDATIFYEGFKNVLQAAHGVALTKETAIPLALIFLENPEILIGCKVDLTIGYQGVSYLDYVEKGVVNIMEWRAKEKVFDRLPIDFKDMNEARAYAEEKDIKLGFPDITKIETSPESYIPEGVEVIYEALGLIEGEGSSEEEVVVEEVVEKPQPKKTRLLL